MCHASYVVVIVKEASHEFREEANDLSQAQSGGLELREGAQGSERGPGSYEEPNIESVPYAYRV